MLPALHVSEDELVRRAIDALLAEPPTAPDHLQAAAEFLEAAREIAESRVGPSRAGSVATRSTKSARRAGRPRDDFSAGAVIEGVTFIDPFGPTFDVEKLA